MRGAALGGPRGPIADEDLSPYRTRVYDRFRGVALSTYMTDTYDAKKKRV